MGVAINVDEEQLSWADAPQGKCAVSDELSAREDLSEKRELHVFYDLHYIKILHAYGVQ